MKEKYKYIITYKTVLAPFTKTEEFFPVNTDSIEILHQKEENHVFKRRKINSQLIFRNDAKTSVTDYDKFKMMEENFLCDKIELTIQKLCDNSFQDYWNGFFAITDGEFDDDTCRFYVTPIVEDEYTCLLDNADTKKNILELFPTFELVSEKQLFDVETLICSEDVPVGVGTLYGVEVHCVYSASPTYAMLVPVYSIVAIPSTLVNCEPSGQGWDVYEHRITFKTLTAFGCNSPFIGSASGVYTRTTTYKRYITTTFDVGGVPQPPSGAGWIDLGLIPGSTSERQWARPLVLGAPTWVGSTEDTEITDRTYFTPGNTPYIPTERAFSRDYVITLGNADSNVEEVEYSRMRHLWDVIKFLIQDCEIYDFKSEFLTAVTNPITNDANKLIGLYLAQKSDMILVNGVESTEPATLGEMSFNDLMEILSCLNIGWDIDDNLLRIEHIEFYDNGFSYAGPPVVGVDLTNLTNPKTKSTYIENKNRYEYLKLDMPKYEKFTWMEAANEDFIGAPIYYDSFCVNSKPNENTIDRDLSNVTTDLIYVQNFPSEIDKNGFMFIQGDYVPPDFVGPVILRVGIEVGMLSGDNIINGHLSWANLHYTYWRYGRILDEGIMNNQLTSFFSSIKIKKQVPLVFHNCSCDFDANEYIKTYLGDGEIDEASENLNTEMITVTLKY